MSLETVREQWIARCVAGVLERLRQREESECVLPLVALPNGWPADTALRHAGLRITQVTPCFLRGIGTALGATAELDAFSRARREGMRVVLEVDWACFGLLPIADLLRLPLKLRATDGRPIHLLARRVAGYADIRPLAPGYLVLTRRVLLTALAREAVAARRLQLYRQD